ncbi:MAG: uracil-DNA glycosylase [Pseudomonadota bacterium]
MDRFLAGCGVTAHLAETPQNRFAEAAEPRSAPAFAQLKHEDGLAAPAVITPSSGNGVGDEAPALMEAREAARTAPNLEALYAAIHAFDGCPLKSTATQACPGEGPLGAPVMFVGEAPGRDEDAAGRPFVGRSGKLLDKMIAAIGLTREAVYVTNVIPWRPPGNRTPSPIETATCEVFVRREIALVAPKVLVPLGGPAAKTLLRTDAGIMRQRGRWSRYEDDAAEAGAIDALAMFHPAYLLRTPAAKKQTWQDLLAVAGKVGSLPAN